MIWNPCSLNANIQCLSVVEMFSHCPPRKTLGPNHDQDNWVDSESQRYEVGLRQNPHPCENCRSNQTPLNCNAI